MEEIIAINGLNKWQLKAANMCQIYSREIMISDIANTQGTAIPLGRLLGHWSIKSKLAWIELPAPPPKVWREYWRLTAKEFGQRI